MSVPSFIVGTARRWVCLTVALSLCLPSRMASAQAPLLHAADPPARAGAEAIQIPMEWGEIQERFGGQGSGTVVLIQDAHSLYEAQKSIEKIISHLSREYGFQRGGTEGGTGPVHPVLLQSYPNRADLEDVLEDYLRGGELSGAVTAAVRLNGRFDLQALEDRPLYEAAIRAYRRAAAVRPQNLSRVSAAFNELDRLLAGVVSSERLEFLRLDREFRSGRSRDLGGYLKALSRFQEPGGRFPLIGSLLRDLEEPDEAEERACAAEMERLTARLAAEGLRGEDLRAMNQRIQAYRTSEAGLRQTAGELLALVRSAGLDSGNYPHLQNAAASNDSLRLEMKGPAFFSELEAYGAAIRDSFLTGSEERRLNEFSEKLMLLERLCGLELTLEQWTRYRTMRETGAFAGLMESLFEDGKALETEGAEIFYKTAEERDRVFLQRIQQERAARGGGDYVFLAGGFHAGGLTSLLRAEGIPYVLVMPRISEVPQQVPYERMMKADVSWKDFFRAENGEVDLEAAFMRGAVRRLMNQGPGDDGEKVLRLWRDEVIRRLAAEGEAGESGRYTRFLDEAVSPAHVQDGFSGAAAEHLLNGLKKLVSDHRLTSENAAQLLGAHAAMPFTNINAGVISADLVESVPVLSESRSELRVQEETPRRLGAFMGITGDMPIVDFLAAFGIDAASAVPEPVPGMPDFGRVPAALTEDVLESAAAIFLTENTYVQARAYVKAVNEKNLEALRDLYLLTYQGRPAAMIWARNVPSEGQNGYAQPKTLIYPLLVYQQTALFSVSPEKLSMPPFPDPKAGRSIYESVITPFVRSVHGTSGHFNNLNALDDPYHESPQSAMHVRAWDDMKSGFAFPGTYGPWEHSTRFLLQMLDTHLLMKLGREDLRGLNLVDVGSGAGRVSVHLAAQGADVQAYDLTLMKAMNTRAWARVNGLMSRIRARKALSVTELDPADGYIVNFPNLDENAKRLGDLALMTYEDSRHLNISIHPEDFRKVMEDLRERAKPGAFLFIRGNYTGRGLELFEPIMRETGWIEGLEAPLPVPEGVDPFGAAYFLRQGPVRSELRSVLPSDSDVQARDADLREKYERILREASFGRRIETLLGNFLRALERPERERVLVWYENPGTALDQIISALRSANSHYRILSPGSLRRGDHLMILETPGTGARGLGQKELNAIFGEEKVNRLIELRRRALIDALDKTRLYDFTEELLYSTYKEDAVRLRLMEANADFPESGRWSHPGGIEELGEELLRRTSEAVTAALRDPSGPYRAVLELPASKALLARKGITDLDRQPLYELNFGMSQVRDDSAAARLNADINAHQALTLANLAAGEKISRVFEPRIYRERILEAGKLREQLTEQAPEGRSVMQLSAAGAELKPAASEILRKRYAWDSLSEAQKEVFAGSRAYYEAAQRYFDLLRLQDYIKKWDVSFEKAVSEATVIRSLIAKLEKYRRLTQIALPSEPIESLADEETIIRDRDKRLFQKLPGFLLQDSRRRSLYNAKRFHAQVPAMKNPVYVNLDVKGMGLMNIRAFEHELQAIEKELRENGSPTSEVYRLWRSSADDVTVRVQGIEPILKSLLEEAYREEGVTPPSEIPAMMGGDEVVFALDGDFFSGERIDRLLFTLRDSIRRQLGIEVRAGVSQRIQDYREHFSGHPNAADVAHAKAMLAIDDVTAMLKSLEALELKGALKDERRGAVVYHGPGPSEGTWTAKTADESGRVSSFDAALAVQTQGRSELREVSAEALDNARGLGKDLVDALFEGRAAEGLVLKLTALMGAAENAEETLWPAFEGAYRAALEQRRLSAAAPALTGEEAGAVRAMISGGTLFPALERLYQNRTGMKAVSAEVPEPPVSFAVGEKLVYQASLRTSGPNSEDGVSGILRTALEDGGRLIVAAQGASHSSAAASRALDEALRSLGGQVRADRLNRVRTGEVTPLGLLEDRLGKDGDISRFVVFFENGDGQIVLETPDQKKRGLVFVIEPEALSLLSVPEVMRILKKLALVPETLREFYRDELGLRPNPESGLTVIGRDFLKRLAHIAQADARIQTSA